MAGFYMVRCYADNPVEWNCSQWRDLTPADAFNAAGDGYRAKLIHVSGFLDFLNPAIQALVAPADIIFFQRNLVVPAALDAIRYWQGMGKVVVADLDDAYHMLPWSNPAHTFWIENPANRQPPPLVMLEQGLSQVDALTAPNRLLLADWSHVVKGYYLPNYAEGRWWKDLPSRQELKAERGLEERIVIGWGGSVSHYDSWWGSGIREAARQICKRHPEVVWLICGNDPRIHAQLPVPSDQKIAQAGVPPAEWPRTVRCFDIGVAPLFGPYDQRRSWIKGLEYLLAGVPWIGTRGEPYRDLAALGRLIPNGADSWEEALEDLLAHLEEEQARAEKLIPMAQQWLMENQVENYVHICRQIIQDAQAERGALPGVIRVSPDGAKATSEVASELDAETA